MKPIINGTTQPVRTQLRMAFDPTKGFTTTQEWESAGDNLNGLALECLQKRIQFDHIPNGRKSKLVISATGPQTGIPDVPVDTWQVLANEVQKDIKEHPAVVAIIRPFSGPSLSEVLQVVQEYNEGIGGIDSTWFTDTDTAAILFRLMIHGVTSYALGQYVLRHTTNVNNSYDRNVADLNVERVYTTPQLVAEITDGSSWAFPCPGRLVHKIQDMEIQNTDPDVTWGWRKLPSTEVTAANNRIDISTEYWLAGWSKLLYGTL